MRPIPIVLTAVLVIIWLLLNNTLAIEHIVLGTVLSVLLALGARQLRPLEPKLRRIYLIPWFIVVVLVDILRSNIGVGRIVLGLVRDREVRSGFIVVPLDMRDPHGLSMLAAVVTATPGTAWAGLSPDGSELTLHILDVKDESEWIRMIKTRYERPLMRIFE
ncbi:MAG: Na+/H+ antiporter subunit E [Steroidobacteraceae bacterium]|jgi:multicomponent K+:H+ antiporter subunit E|nr:Na+/H+ antiporter subunit E [Steroidobacteraceae bacterium]